MHSGSVQQGRDSGLVMSKLGRKSAQRKLALAASATLVAAALPSSVFAVGALADGNLAESTQFIFTPAAADPEIAELVARSGANQAQMLRFTPAGDAAPGPERSVTATVRVDQQTAQALSGSSSVASSNAAAGLRIAPMRYNLGIARGYGNFAPTTASAPARLTTPSAPVLSRNLSEAALPEISSYAPRRASGEDDSRFAARVALEEGRSATARDAQNPVSDQMLDVGGSFRLTNNIDLTAGVRVEQDRDIVPLPDVDQQDSQAVYIGTQFRF